MSFQQVYDHLSKFPNLDLNDLTGFAACQRRLLDALNSGAEIGASDIVALIRHVLRYEAELQGGVSPTIKVPRIKPFPKDRKTWELSSMEILDEKPDSFVLRACPWTPEWLSGSEQLFPEPPLVGEKAKRRSYDAVTGDPFLSLVGHATYQSVGQREAIRSILTAPKNATLVVNLPTGSGKSLCAHLPAQLKSQPGVTIVIVPTVALAIDQDRAFREKTGTDYETAYYSDSSVDGQERRDEIRDRIRKGTQSIVFTSPEGLIESLSHSVYHAARQGFLRYLIIDEAHIVEQWGDEFRPEFQELAGLRNSLLRLTSFPTLLLTATVTESCLDTLETLFGEPGAFQVVSSVQLRPEPAYWFARCSSSEEEREQRLVETLHHLPRPLIIYGSKVADVERWYKKLRSAGFKRIDKMTGKSSQQERSQLLNAWGKGQIDIVVATSAFGLGVDLSDVRAVIHVCIPETIDRFYQEVGRGGRDGKATLSLTLYTQSDYEVASSLSKITYISSKLGKSRWEEMFARKSSLPDGRFQVPIDVKPPYNLDLDPASTGNQEWNIRTLTLMSRAGLLKLDAEPPPQRTNFDLDSVYEEALDRHRNLRTVRILNDAHLDLETWDDLVEPARNQRQQWTYHSLKLMKEALTTKRCISEIFAEAYSIPKREVPERKRVHVERSCGGCPVCRKQGLESFAGGIPLPAPVWSKPSFSVGEPLRKLLDGETLLLVFYTAFADKRAERNRDRFFKWSIEQGIQNIVAPASLHQAFGKQAGKIPIFLFEDYQPLQMFKVPTLIFHADDKRISPRCLLPPDSGVPRIVLFPDNTVDPNTEHRQLKNIFNGRNFDFDLLCMELCL